MRQDATASAERPDLSALRKTVLALHDKYDAAIKHIEDRPRMNPPRLLPAAPSSAAPAADGAERSGRGEL